MKNIIKSAFAIAIALVLTSTSAVVFAAPPVSGGGSTAGTGAPPTTGGGSTAGNGAPGTSGGGSTAGEGSDSDSGSRSRRSGGGGGYVTVRLDNVKIATVANGYSISWNTIPDTFGRIVYGKTSVSAIDTTKPNFGYTNGTTQSAVRSEGHFATIVANKNEVIFVRPVAVIGNRTIFGSEIRVAPIATGVNTSKTATPAAAVKTSPGAPLKIDLLVPGDEIAKTEESSDNVAAAKQGLTARVGAFFGKIWNSVTAPICR